MGSRELQLGRGGLKLRLSERSFSPMEKERFRERQRNVCKMWEKPLACLREEQRFSVTGIKDASHGHQ